MIQVSTPTGHEVIEVPHVPNEDVQGDVDKGVVDEDPPPKAAHC
ncbi:MAG: hypothetical protein AAF587_45085 [Bacteroidota bacterium]